MDFTITVLCKAENATFAITEFEKLIPDADKDIWLHARADTQDDVFGSFLEGMKGQRMALEGEKLRILAKDEQVEGPVILGEDLELISYSLDPIE